MTNYLNAQAYYFESWLEERTKDIHTIANWDIVKDYNFEKALASFLEFESKSDFSDIVFVNREGLVQFDTVSGYREAGTEMDVSDREYFRVAKIGKQQYITDVQISTVTNKPIISIASPIFDEKQNFNGVVFGSVNLETIDRLLYESRVGQIGYTYLINQEGILLSELNFDVQIEQRRKSEHLFSEKYNIDEHIIKLAMKQNGSALKNYKGVNGESVLGESQAINGGKWYIISEVGVLDAYSPFVQKLIILGIFVLVGSFATVRLMLHLSRKIEEPIQHLIEGVHYIEQGNYDYKINEKHINPYAKEFRELCSAFNQMSGKVKENTILLEGLSTTCQLTNIHNRRYLMEHGERIFNECVRSGNHCSCIALDIDFFKKVNDMYGHIIGDEVLKHVAKIISDSIRNKDIVTRYGGEEFIILSPTTSIEISAKMAERIRQEIELTPFVKGTTKIYITASIGISEYYESAEISTFSCLIDRADKALYVAKDSGRNQIQLFKSK